MVAAVEPGSDFSGLLQRYGVGRSVAFSDAQGFFEACEAMAAGGRIEAAARACLDEVFHVRHAVAAVAETEGSPGR